MMIGQWGGVMMILLMVVSMGIMAGLSHDVSSQASRLL